MRYKGIIKEDLVNSKNSINCTLFFQGCSRHCENCFNKDTWDFNGGYEFTKEKQEKFIELCNKEYIDSISILGGEPFDQNKDELLDFLTNLKEKCNKPIYCWTGYTIENLLQLEMKDLLLKIDYLIDGPFIQELADSKLDLRGSSNQRIIDIKQFFNS